MRASRSPEGSSHELVRTLRAQAAGAPRRARGAADARLLRRHPRPGRPHAAATRLDLPRKVAPHVRRLRTALDRAARPRCAPSSVAALLLIAARRRPRAASPAAASAASRRRSARPRTASSPSSTRTARSGQASPMPQNSGSSFRDRATSAPCSRRRHQARLSPQGLARQLRHRRRRRRMAERRTRSCRRGHSDPSHTSAGRRTAAPSWSAPRPTSCSPSMRRGKASRP